MVKPSGKSIKTRNASTEQKILEAACREFVERGISGARMQAIASRAGVNKALLHYYFRSKERLYEAALAHIVGRVWGSVRNNLRIPDSAAPGPRILIETVVTTILRVIQENPDFVRVLIREVTEGGHRLPSVISNAFVGEFGDMPPILLNALHEAIRKKRIRPLEPIHIFINIMGMCIASVVVQPVLKVVGPLILKQEFKFDDTYYQQRVSAITQMACDGLLTKE
ncbi:MAG: TetR/AcrR family transcriptional regulator [Fibrobacterota bacterium]